MSHDTQFVFMTCRVGAEDAAKAEVARVEPTWRISFSRPGFLTFKVAGDRPIDARQLAERNWTFAHAHGKSLGPVAGEKLEGLATQVWQQEAVSTLASGEGFGDAHVWQPGEAVHDDDAQESWNTPLCQAIREALTVAAPNDWQAGGFSPPGQARRLAGDADQHTHNRRRPAPRNALVLDVIVLSPGEWWLGYHRAVRRHERWPAGAIPVRVPEHAVSRAYAKMEEAIQWSGTPMAAEDECVEIGCAPGGASQALLERGLFVTGIDPADVDPLVLEHPHFRHLKKRGKEVRSREFEGVRWLAADMNIAPDATLDEVEAVVTRPGVSIRGLILTLKFSDWSAAARVPEFVERVGRWGYRDVRTRQLVTGGQEVCLVALRRKALRRLGRKRRPRSADKPEKPISSGGTG